MAIQMLRSKLYMVIALGLALVIPYVAFDPDLRARAKQTIGQVFSNDDNELTLDIAGQLPDPEDPGHSIEHHVNDRDTPILFTPNVPDFSQVFRFDITPNWVKSRWPRVSACGMEDGMEGYRVPLVTGTAIHDIHGSLTYYFDSQHNVQRISFYGYCGDATRLVQMVMQQFGFQAKPTHAAGLYLRSYMGKPVGALRIINSAIVRADKPNDQLQVMLEINNNLGAFKMSDGFARILNADQASGRW